MVNLQRNRLLFAVQSILNLLQAQSLRLHDGGEGEHERYPTQDAKDPERPMGSDGLVKIGKELQNDKAEHPAG
uniref:Putative secreted protein n=1 Tax=Anopheles darlingi TaxID=43151 RepID=A0A2M4D8I3_ANODA